MACITERSAKNNTQGVCCLWHLPFLLVYGLFLCCWKIGHF